MNRRRFLGAAALVPLAPVFGWKVLEGFLSRAAKPQPTTITVPPGCGCSITTTNDSVIHFCEFIPGPDHLFLVNNMKMTSPVTHFSSGTHYSDTCPTLKRLTGEP